MRAVADAALAVPFGIIGKRQHMVMDKDEQLRDNRLKLLNRFEAVFSGIANIGELARKK